MHDDFPKIPTVLYILFFLFTLILIICIPSLQSILTYLNALCVYHSTASITAERGTERKKRRKKKEKKGREGGRKGQLEALLQKFVQQRHTRDSPRVFTARHNKSGAITSKREKNISGRFSSPESTLLTGKMFNIYKCNLQLLGEL